MTSVTSLKNILKEFELEESFLRGLVDDFVCELERGLREPGQMLKNLPTYVTRLPTGKEQGEFLVVDFGGSNLRVGRVRLGGDNTFSLNRLRWQLDEKVKGGESKELFEFIVDKLVEYLQSEIEGESESGEVEKKQPKESHQFHEPRQSHQAHQQKQSNQSKETQNIDIQMLSSLLPKTPLGFTFSYPVEQEGLAHGILIQWNKALRVRNVVGNDVVKLMECALHARKLPIKVGALLNDTVGTLAAHLYRDPLTRISVILGTGTNAAFVVPIEKIAKLRGTFRQSSPNEQMIINAEWGAFGDDGYGEGRLYLKTTEFDRVIDRETSNAGRQRFEKMISGMYLGELVRLVLMQVFSQISTTSSPFALETADLALIESDLEGGEITRQILQERLKLTLSTREELEMVRQTCCTISTRSSNLCAVGIAAVYRLLQREVEEEGEMVIAIDGGLYENYPFYPQRLLAALKKLLPPKATIRIDLAKDESMIGAATVVAAAMRGMSGGE